VISAKPVKEIFYLCIYLLKAKGPKSHSHCSVITYKHIIQWVNPPESSRIADLLYYNTKEPYGYTYLLTTETEGLPKC